ncbi:MAG: M15 family metallopeptidase, partial [Actinomycetota bacterium]
RNPYGEKPRQDPRLVALMERWGFTWGGRWLVPDGMHFEFVRFVNPASPPPLPSPSAGG